MTAHRRTLSIDIETHSSVDLKRHGVHRYVASPDFEVILFQYRYDSEPAEVVHVVQLLCGETVPAEVLADLTDPTVLKTGWNCAFERTCLAVWLLCEMPAEQWLCTMVSAAMLGLPLDLDRCGKVLKIKNKKLVSGYSSMRFFAMPCKPTKSNGGRTRNLPHHDPDKWKLFCDYGRVDVLAETEIASRVAKHPPSAQERELWFLDQRVNDRGVRVDLTLAAEAVALNDTFKERCLVEAKALTGLANPNSVAQLKGWLEQAESIEIESLNKKIVPQLLKNASNDTVKRVLELRGALAKGSVGKYKAMLNRTSADEFFRASLQFYGANRTGRWAGRGVQVHNLPTNTMKMLLTAREMLRRGDHELLEMLFGVPTYVMAQLLRTAFIPDNDDEVFFAVDFKAIEARGLAWGAGEQWRLDVFATHGYIYEASASQMFNVPWADFQAYIDRDEKHPLRKQGKVAELALGYQGGEGALVKMGALEMGLKIEELDPIKVSWRAANLKISGRSYRDEPPGMWEKMEEGALKCVRTRSTVEVDVPGTRFRFEHGILFMVLPSGRELAYPQAKIAAGLYGPVVQYNGLDDKNRWGHIQTYGGMLTENWDQAISRDVLCAKLLRISVIPAYRDRLRMHVHDEGVWSVPRVGYRVEDLEEIFAEPLDWAPGLPLAGDGDVLEFYMKTG